MEYQQFLASKAQDNTFSGFEPLWMPDFLFDFQAALVDWAIRKGKAAIFADCGMGKTPMQLVWSENVVRKTNGRVLILTPLAVSHQTCEEAAKFGIEAHRSHAGELHPGINVTNYERLHLFDSNDFVGCVCDESSILKSFAGKRRREITDFMRKMPYRLLATATAAPNDYVELGTSSQALGSLEYTEMLQRFFKNDQNDTIDTRAKWAAHGGVAPKWRFRGHAEIPFWRWVSSWARALRRPSDLGFDDGAFILPPLIENEHVVVSDTLADGFLFALPAFGLAQQREERKRTIEDRCEKSAAIVACIGTAPAIMWCHMNAEGELLRKIVPDSVEVSGADPDDMKEEKFDMFLKGRARVLITKPKIGAWGLNFQHCAHMTFFPSHSFEQYYQGVRRCWRFGQTRPVTVDIVSTEGELSIKANLQRKSIAADKMFSELVKHMQEAVVFDRQNRFTKEEEIPSWL